MMKLRRPSRREFLGVLSASAVLGQQRTEPDLVLYNANILTVDAAQPRAQAVAIAGGRFFAVGSNDDVRRLAKAGTRQIEIGGKNVVPGFIAPPTHPSYPALPPSRCLASHLPSL